MPALITVTSPAQADDPIAEVQQTQKELQRAYEDTTKKITAVGSFGTGDAGQNPGLPQNGQLLQPGSPGGITVPDLEFLQKFSGQPQIRKVVQVVQNPVTLQNVTAFVTHPKRAELGYAEVAWLLALLILRSYRLAKANHWFKHLWVSFSNFCLFWIGAFGLLPYFIIGDPFTRLITDTYQLYKAAH